MENGKMGYVMALENLNSKMDHIIEEIFIKENNMEMEPLLKKEKIID